jgi:hypothetical protein
MARASDDLAASRPANAAGDAVIYLDYQATTPTP